MDPLSHHIRDGVCINRSMDLLDVEPSHPARFDTTIHSWVLTRHADVDAALRDRRLSCGSEGDWHGRYRQAAMEAFSRSKIESWLPTIEQDALRICRSLRAEATLDLVHDFAEPWSAAVAEI